MCLMQSDVCQLGIQGTACSLLYVQMHRVKGRLNPNWFQRIRNATPTIFTHNPDAHSPDASQITVD